MTDLRKAAEMALEVFDGPVLKDATTHAMRLRKACDLLRQALAQPVDAVNMSQERVDETAKGEHEPLVWMNKYGHVASFQNEEYKDPLYTAPPKKEWVGLTHDEVDSWELPDSPTVFEFAQFIEAKLKEKNA